MIDFHTKLADILGKHDELGISKLTESKNALEKAIGYTEELKDIAANECAEAKKTGVKNYDALERKAE